MEDPEPRLRVRVAGNTLIPCLHAIVAKGYAVTYATVGGQPQWDAAGDGRHFSATSPEELLGLIAMCEIRGDSWRIRPGEAALYHAILDAAPEEDGEELHGDDG
ncbi:hypothetical protein F8S13_12260 [Chloroflexia bacterium SDU3-3]|nr:hypothetical protein F8S13_12260 [Chloroflexia bacterium SDU3-3]